MKKMIVCFLLFPIFLHGQIITTIAGTGSSVGSGDRGPATAAGIPDPCAGVFDKYGNYYFADGDGTNSVRKIDVSGIISTIAGTGSAGFSGDGGLATLAKLDLPQDVAIDTFGNLYIADGSNDRIRKISIATGIITTVAGSGAAGGTGSFSGDGGPATGATLNDPQGVCLDKFGNMYIADLINCRVRKVNTAGVISTFAGTGYPGYSGDGGAASAAELSAGVVGVVADDTGNIYIADGSNGRVRKVDLTGVITTFAGSGYGSYTGDGIPATSSVILPTQLTFDNLGQLYITDRVNLRIYKVDIAGILHCIAGIGSSGFSGDGGPATAAQLDFPFGVNINACGDVYFEDVVNHRIRKITYPPSPPVITLSAPTSSALGSSVIVRANITGGCCGHADSVIWMDKGIVFATTTTDTVSFTKIMSTDSITVKAIGCGDTAVSGVYVVTNSKIGVPEVTAQNSFQLYPNPVRGVLYIAGDLPLASVSIFNLLGQCVFSKEFNGEKDATVPFADMPNGMYFVRVNNMYVERVVKE